MAGGQQARRLRTGAQGIRTHSASPARRRPLGRVVFNFQRPVLRWTAGAANQPRCKCRPRLRYTNDLDGPRLRARAFS